jgi:acetyl esterase/lipase
MDPREILTRPAPSPGLFLRYGPGPDQVSDLWLPSGRGDGPAPLVILLHGGFWRAAYDRVHARSLAAALTSEGVPVCLPEYRRTGQEGGGWPGTFDDVAAAVDALPGLAASAAPGEVLAGGVVLAGHSAGGHLALWAASRELLPAGSRWHCPPGVVRGVVALAAVSDLAGCAQQNLGGGAAQALMGGGPSEWPERYAEADPSRLLPVPGAVRLVHGEQDGIVPCSMSSGYAERAAGTGGDVACVVLPGVGHFEVIDPRSGAWDAVLGATREVVGTGRGEGAAPDA